MTPTDSPALAGATRPGLPATRSARWGAWLLAISPLYFALVVVTNVGAFASAGIGLFEDITREQMNAIAFGWVLSSILFPLAFVLGSLGTALLAASLAKYGGATRAWAWASIAAAVAAIALFLPYAPFRILAMGFSEARLGDNRWYTFWDAAGYIGSDAAILAVVLLCAAVFAGTRHRTVALVIGGLAVVYLVVTVVGIALPPFVVALLWCPLGIVWLRRMPRRGRVRSGALAAADSRP